MKWHDRLVQFMQVKGVFRPAAGRFWAGMKPFLLFCCLALLPCLLIAFGCSFPKVEQTMAERKDLLPIYSVETQEKKAALTFDAAWEGGDIPALLDILQQAKVQATFFIVGDFARANPEMVQKIAAAGHEIANHSDRHPHPLRCTLDRLQADAKACDACLRKLGVTPVPYYRAPYGEYDRNTVAAIIQLGLQPIQWSVDSLDWKNKSPEEMVQRVSKRIRPGDILLFHTGKDNTKEALPRLLSAIRQKGIALVPLSRLLYNEPWFLDQAGRQHPYS